MTKTIDRAGQIIFGSFASILLLAISFSFIWYFVDRYYPEQGFFSDAPIVYALIGAVFGIACGMIIGLIVTIWRLGRIQAAVGGGFIGCCSLLLLIMLLGGGGPSTHVAWTLAFTSLGQGIAGAVVGLLVSMLCSYMDRCPSEF